MPGGPGGVRPGGRLSPERLAALTAFPHLEGASYRGLEEVVRQSAAAQFAPNKDAAEDPRTEGWITYSEARRRRPVSLAGPPDAAGSLEHGREVTECIVCTARLTPVVDAAPLSIGATFITPNLYPMVYPFPQADCRGGRGLHLIQWCSTEHDADLHNMPLADIDTVLRRLAALERFLLHSGAEGFPRSDDGHAGFAAVMKNRGLKVGGSVEHGHQQIAHLQVLPRALGLDRDFMRKEGRPYAAALRRAAGENLVVCDYPGGVRALVPPGMRRPLEAAVLPPEDAGEYLHDLDGPVLSGIGQALRELTGALHLLMESRRLSFDYNLAFHVGPVGLCYIEVLPYTQPYGGFEHLGHYLCQEEPASSAAAYRGVLF